MGIRIHKCIGYGLTDVKTKDYSIADDRFYELGAMEAYNKEFFVCAEKTWTKKDFIKYIKSHMEWSGLHIDLIEKMKRWYISDMLVHDSEYGLDNVFLIIPPGYSDWSRYDDIIDYTEINGIARNTVQTLQQGIWPYRGLHQNQHGEQLNSTFSCAWWRYYNDILDGYTPQENIQGMNIVLHSISTKMGFENFFDAKDNMAPLIPDILRAFCEWTNIFTDPDTINQLRPMIYTYWS